MVRLIIVLVFTLQRCFSVQTSTAPAGQSCWTKCTKTCGGGTQVTCVNSTAVTRACNTMRCPGDPEWTKCTLTCGGGMQRNIDNSSIIRTCNTMSCPGDAGCLSAYLSFEHVLNNVVYDESHNGNAGTLNGRAKIVQNGKFGKGLQLTEDGNVTFDVERFHNRPTDAITVSLWLNLSQVNGSHELFFTCGTPELYNMGDYHFAVNNGKVHWLEELPGGSTRFNVFSDKNLQSSQWYHIAGSYRASTGRSRLYINGALANETELPTTLRRSTVPDANKFAQARWKCANLGAPNMEKPLRGILDEFRIFKCELLPEEIMDLYSKNYVKKFRIPFPNYNFKWNREKQATGLDFGISRR
ncbi:uncharacterized protein [Montipora capricornis]|uniref:uncharacterized protein isoform X1 n=2 Tax=Montipora capricornis TaxID=246305 RepID=UPI0035F1C7A1